MADTIILTFHLFTMCCHDMCYVCTHRVAHESIRFLQIYLLTFIHTCDGYLTYMLIFFIKHFVTSIHILRNTDR